MRQYKSTRLFFKYLNTKTMTFLHNIRKYMQLLFLIVGDLIIIVHRHTDGGTVWRVLYFVLRPRWPSCKCMTIAGEMVQRLRGLSDVIIMQLPPGRDSCMMSLRRLYNKHEHLILFILLCRQALWNLKPYHLPIMNHIALILK